MKCIVSEMIGGCHSIGLQNIQARSSPLPTAEVKKQPSDHCKSSLCSPSLLPPRHFLSETVFLSSSDSQRKC